MDLHVPDLLPRMALAWFHFCTGGLCACPGPAQGSHVLKLLQTRAQPGHAQVRMSGEVSMRQKRHVLRILAPSNPSKILTHTRLHLVVPKENKFPFISSFPKLVLFNNMKLIYFRLSITNDEGFLPFCILRKQVPLNFFPLQSLLSEENLKFLYYKRSKIISSVIPF